MQKLENALVSMKPTKGRMRTTWTRPWKNRGIPPGWRRSSGRDSGTTNQARAAMSSVKAASAQKTTLHVACVMMKAPRTGASIGAKPTIAWRRLIARASVLPCATSTRIARPTEEATPPPRPWKTRPTRSTQMPGVNTQIMEPTRAMMPPATMGRRRPIWSEMAPPRTWPDA